MFRAMKLDEVQPGHCLARAARLLAEIALVRDETGRVEDGRPAPEISGAQPREVYFEALAAQHKARRLARELGVAAVHPQPAAPPLRELRPGHVLAVIDGVLEQVVAIKQRLGIGETSAEPTVDLARQPSDVLALMVRCNRELSRVLERPFAPADCYATVALASAYAARLGGSAAMAPFERRRKPQHCYERLEACLQRAAALIGKRGETALAARGRPPEILPGDVYDLANVVLGELAFLHALAGAPPVHPFEVVDCGHRLPAHVDQLARTLDAQLAALG
jgi:hypothetical protein